MANLLQKGSSNISLLQVLFELADTFAEWLVTKKKAALNEKSLFSGRTDLPLKIRKHIKPINLVVFYHYQRRN